MGGVVRQGPCHGERVKYVLYCAYGSFRWQLRGAVATPFFRARWLI